MKTIRREHRIRLPASRFLEVAETIRGWRWLPWVIRKIQQGCLGGVQDRAWRMGVTPGTEVKITGKWGTGHRNLKDDGQDRDLPEEEA
jgi:hypothetical protein